MNDAYSNPLLKGQNAQRLQPLQQILKFLSLRAIAALISQRHCTTKRNSARSQTCVSYYKLRQPLE
jgi:hypothetical protein